MNLWKSARLRTKKGVNCIVEIPKGSRKKYELDIKTGKFVLSRTLDKKYTYPLNYGFIPGTLASDKDPLDVIILGKKLIKGSIVLCRIIALLKMKDDHLTDDKILAIPLRELSLQNIRDLNDVPSNILKDIKYFFKHYKEREVKKTKVFKWLPCSKAQSEIRLSTQRFESMKNVL